MLNAHLVRAVEDFEYVFSMLTSPIRRCFHNLPAIKGAQDAVCMWHSEISVDTGVQHQCDQVTVLSKSLRTDLAECDVKKLSDAMVVT